MSSRLFSEKMKISIRMVLVLQWVLAICALSSRDWLPPGYQWCQVRHISLFKAVAKDHLKSLVRSSTCLVILDFLHFTPLVLIGKKYFFFLKLEARLEAVIFSYPLK